MLARWSRLAIVGIALLLSGPASAYDDLGLRLIPDDPARPLEHLDTNERLARIDAIEPLLDAKVSLPDSTVLKLSLLYSSSQLMKDKVRALTFDDVLADPHALEAMRERAHRYVRVWNFSEAEAVFEELVERYPDVAIAHRDRGVFLLDLGLSNLDDDRLAQALASFRRAVACPDAGYDDWLGLASALLATDHRYELTDVGERLMEDPRGAVAGRLYAALGYRARDQEYSAESLFRDAIAHLQPDTQDRFLDLEGFLQQFQPILLTDGALEPLAPKDLLGWWERLVECEVLFGEPLREVHGWGTAPGKVYLTFGRPERHYYFPPFGNRTAQEVEAFTKVSDYRNDLVLSLLEAGDDGMWVWFLKPGDAEIPYVFTKGAQYADWHSTLHSYTRFAEPLKEAMPLALDAPPPVANQPQAELRLGARHVTFVASEDHIRAESYLSVQPVNVDADVQLTASLVILDEKNEVVEKTSSPLRAVDERAAMLSRVPGTSGKVTAGIAAFGASLPPGRYVFRLQVENADHGLYAATDQAFWLRGHRAGFRMSDLLLADSFAGHAPAMQLPAPFVKYARAVMPHPEYRVHPGQKTIYVYYEVYGAQIDEAGNAHLDTLYEIFQRRDFDPLDAGRPDGQGSRPVVRVQFPTESIGRSGEGIVVKGTKVDLTELPAGDYVLAVRVTDRLGHRESQSFVPFGR